MIQQRQKAEGWGPAVIPRLARDIRNELPEVKGFSEPTFPHSPSAPSAKSVASPYSLQPKTRQPSPPTPMEQSRAIDILQALADGRDPATGQPPDTAPPANRPLQTAN